MILVINLYTLEKYNGNNSCAQQTVGAGAAKTKWDEFELTVPTSKRSVWDNPY